MNKARKMKKAEMITQLNGKYVEKAKAKKEDETLCNSFSNRMSETIEGQGMREGNTKNVFEQAIYIL